MVPLCVLDFYVHESRQRKGCGKRLFEAMLEVCGLMVCTRACMYWKIALFPEGTVILYIFSYLWMLGECNVQVHVPRAGYNWEVVGCEVEQGLD